MNMCPARLRCVSTGQSRILIKGREGERKRPGRVVHSMIELNSTQCRPQDSRAVMGTHSCDSIRFDAITTAIKSNYCIETSS